jgi:Adenylate and Guanylate cyclase catalytic domain
MTALRSIRGGDAFFAVFSSPRACLAAATEMQRALEAHAWPAGEHVRVRMGIHTGEASRTATGLVGLEVHRAARVAAVGYGGQVLLSETAAALVREALPPGASLTDLGVHRLKDLGRPERIFQLQAAVLHGAAQAFLDPTGPPREELEARYRQDSLEQARAHLGPERFEQAHAQGMALSFDQALDLAAAAAHPG